MGRSQRIKGRAWEQTVARLFRALFGEKVKRGWQTRAGSDAPDVDGTPWFIECKKGKRIAILAALEQAKKASDGRPPLAVTYEDRGDKIASMYLGDFMALIHEWYSLKYPGEAPAKVPTETDDDDVLL
jgi:hypothetical protein